MGWRSWLVLAFLVCLTTASLAAPSSTNATRRPQPERWLLVIETSARMERRALALEGLIGDLLASGIQGQLQEGDEIGIWTYNKKLFAGIAPIQTWTPAVSNQIAGRTARFIGGQEYRDKARWSEVVSELDQVVKKSRKLTILIFSDGSQKMSGTPFDDAINDAYAQYRPELSPTRMPLITVLRSERGQYLGQVVSIAPWPITYPSFQVEVDPEPAPAPKPVERKKAIIIGTPKKTVSSPSTNALIMSGASSPQTPPPVAEVKPAPVVPTQTAPKVNPEPPKPAPVPAPPPTAPVPVPAPEPTPVEMAKLEPRQPEPTAAARSTAVPEVAVAPAPSAAPEPAAGNWFSSRRWFLILGLGCLWVAIVIALVLARRSRRSHAASLITRSFDRNQH